jgi:hypothetical protein
MPSSRSPENGVHDRRPSLCDAGGFGGNHLEAWRGGRNAVTIKSKMKNPRRTVSYGKGKPFCSPACPLPGNGEVVHSGGRLRPSGEPQPTVGGLEPPGCRVADMRHVVGGQNRSLHGSDDAKEA